MKINTKKITAVGLATLMLGTPIGVFADEDNTTIADIDTTVEVDTTDLEEEVLEIEIEEEDSDVEEDTLSEEEKDFFFKFRRSYIKMGTILRKT